MRHIPGLIYEPNFLTGEEHDELLRQVDSERWLDDFRRRVQHYGYRYDYRNRAIDHSMQLGTLPDWAQALAERLNRKGYIAVVPDQVIVNEYLPGQGIAPHVDCEPCFRDTILSVSLGSSCVMEFSHIYSHEHIPVLLCPCSLVVMQGAARYDWKHGIPARKTDFFEGRHITRSRRVSLTFRAVILTA